MLANNRLSQMEVALRVGCWDMVEMVASAEALGDRTYHLEVLWQPQGTVFLSLLADLVAPILASRVQTWTRKKNTIRANIRATEKRKQTNFFLRRW
jgi:hypothetical protein